jgi:hypothetical protein
MGKNNNRRNQGGRDGNRRERGGRPAGGRPNNGRPTSGVQKNKEAGRPNNNNNRRYDLLKEMNREKVRSSREWARRPQWKAPRPSTEPLPELRCCICGKVINDLDSAITDRTTGEPAHFDCVKEKIEAQENLTEGDVVAYIGGGRFGVVGFSADKPFTIKKIIEWEATTARSDWRTELANRYSST